MNQLFCFLFVLFLLDSFCSESSILSSESENPFFRISIINGLQTLEPKEKELRIPPHILQPSLENSLQTIWLPHCFLAREEIEVIATFLATSPHLQELNIAYNFIDEESARSLGVALAQNTSLTYLDASWNQIGSEGLLREIGFHLYGRKPLLNFLSFAGNHFHELHQENLNQLFRRHIGFLDLSWIPLRPILDALVSQAGKGSINGLKIQTDGDSSQVFSSLSCVTSTGETTRPDLHAAGRVYGVKVLFLNHGWVAKNQCLKQRPIWAISQQDIDPRTLKALPEENPDQVVPGTSQAAAISPLSRRKGYTDLLSLMNPKEDQT